MFMFMSCVNSRNKMSAQDLIRDGWSSLAWHLRITFSFHSQFVIYITGTRNSTTSRGQTKSTRKRHQWFRTLNRFQKMSPSTVITNDWSSLVCGLYLYWRKYLRIFCFFVWYKLFALCVQRFCLSWNSSSSK